MTLAVAFLPRFGARRSVDGECNAESIGDGVFESRTQGADPITDRKLMRSRNQIGCVVVPNVKTVGGQKSVLPPELPVICREVRVVEGTQTG